MNNSILSSYISQAIVLNQTQPQIVRFSGWSKAQGVTGVVDADYSLYIDIKYQDGTNLYGTSASFPIGTQNWNQVLKIINPAKPIFRLLFYCLFRNSHTGKVWFDDISVQVAQGGQSFGLDAVSLVASIPEPTGASSVSFSSTSTQSGSLEFVLDASSGDLLTLAVDGFAVNSNLTPESRLPLHGGFMVRDYAVNGDFYGVPQAPATTQSNVLSQDAVISELNVRATVQHISEPNLGAIRVRFNLTDQTDADRALTAVYAVPIPFSSACTFGQNMVTSIQVASLSGAEYSTYSYRERNVGSRDGQITDIPFQTMTCTLNGGQKIGVAIGFPVSEPRVVRIGYDAGPGLFFASFDLVRVSLP
jgi:hypothetical protein